MTLWISKMNKWFLKRKKIFLYFVIYCQKTPCYFRAGWKRCFHKTQINKWIPQTRKETRKFWLLKKPNDSVDLSSCSKWYEVLTNLFSRHVSVFEIAKLKRLWKLGFFLRWLDIDLQKISPSHQSDKTQNANMEKKIDGWICRSSIHRKTSNHRKPLDGLS